ncbi:MAG: chloride channel protein [Archaeoglobaceae archaeon]
MPQALNNFARWSILGVLIGLVAGAGAVAFYLLLEFTTELFLVKFAEFNPPPAGEVGGWSPPDDFKLVISLLVGGFVSGAIVYSLAPEAEGHGTDAAIRAFHKAEGKIRARIPLIKTIASAITIGSGGSAGREGPIAQIAAGLGSLFAQVFKLSVRDRRLALAVGIGAGVGSIFKAPLGGAILSTEILYKRDFEVEALFPSLIASVTGYIVFCTFDGYQPVFDFPEVHIDAVQIPIFALEGVVCAAFGILYVFCFYRSQRAFTKLFERFNLPVHLKPAFGALLTALVVIAVAKLIDPAAGYGALGMSYGFLQLAMHNLLPFEVLLVLAIVKIIATSFTIGSGGSGGVFAPGLVIGGCVGGAFGLAMHELAPSIVEIQDVPAFVAVGMIALFGGISKAPLAVLIMICEMTQNYQLLFPGMAAVAISYMLTGDITIYSEQVATRAESPAHRMELSVDVLENVKVRETMVPAERVITVKPENSVLEVLELIEKTGHMGFPVVSDGELVGIITFEDVERVPVEERAKTKVADVMTRNVVTVTPDETLEDALVKLVSNNIGRLPVVSDGRLVGLITKGDIIRAHAREVAKLVR